MIKSANWTTSTRNEIKFLLFRLSSLPLFLQQLALPPQDPQPMEPLHHTLLNPPTPTSPQCTSTITLSMMTTLSPTSMPMRRVMVTTPIEDTSLLFLMAGHKLSPIFQDL